MRAELLFQVKIQAEVGGKVCKQQLAKEWGQQGWNDAFEVGYLRPSLCLHKASLVAFIQGNQESLLFK